MSEKSIVPSEGENRPSNFIKTIIDDDLRSGKYDRVHTRFPPEPNGYLHIGHAKSICLNFGLAASYEGVCNIRFDDTNPSKEEMEFVESIKEDIRWLGFDWGKNEFFASDYFGKIYECGIELIEKGLAFVCDLTADEMREYRGTLTEPGKESPYRNRLVEENLELFAKMCAGEYPDGSRVLRAKIDMASPNLNMRDPILFRIMRAHHHRTGDDWCIYPMYDFAHPISDALEGISHSVCTMEFEDHRPLYEWVVENLDLPSRPRQIEFARLNLTDTVMSKRYLRSMVEAGLVSGWDDPRMPTISGLRRRGYTPASIRNFCDMIGVARANSVVDMSMLEHAVRDDLNENADRAMAVLEPLKVIIDNYPGGKVEEIVLENHPGNEERGTRTLKFSREIYVEQEDFAEDPPRKFFRLTPGREVRLKGAYIVKCEYAEKDGAGNVTAVHCTYDPLTRSGGPDADRKVKGTLHWVSAAEAADAEIRIYGRLIREEEAGEDCGETDFSRLINPDSLTVLKNCKVEASLAETEPGRCYQFMRKGYFVADIRDHAAGRPVFNRVVALRDSRKKS